MWRCVEKRLYGKVPFSVPEIGHVIFLDRTGGPNFFFEKGRECVDDWHLG